jgi:alpha-D-ribose 1-methylphosphonate 5-triphosphate diphosphatase
VQDPDVVVSMDYCLTDVWAVLPERIVERATIVVENGQIVSVVEDGAATGHAVSGRGSVCIPGIVDVHHVGWIDDSASPTGITTQFHALPLGSHPDSDDRRALEQLQCAGPTPGDLSAGVDHRPIVCVGPTDASALADGERCAHLCTPERGTLVVSVVDAGLTDDAEAGLTWFTIQARARRVRLLAHAPATADDIDRAVDWGATAIEFPTTIEAARRAHARGMSVVASAADIVATPTNPTAISPLALIELGLCDALASVDDASSLVDAVSLLVLRGICDLRGAVRLVTSGPAELVGLTDRGRLAAGLRGDLVLLHPDREHFRVRRIFRAGNPSAATSGHVAS